MVYRNLHDQARGAVDVSLLVLLMCPTLGRRLPYKTITGRSQSRVLVQAQGYANDIRGIRLQYHGAAIPVHYDTRGLRAGYTRAQDNDNKDKTSQMRRVRSAFRCGWSILHARTPLNSDWQLAISN